MSVTSKWTGGSSILKDHTAVNRVRSLADQKNRVRFSLSVTQTIRDVLLLVEERGNMSAYEDYICMLKTTAMDDDAFSQLIGQCKEAIQLLLPKYAHLVETVLGLAWLKRPQAIREEYKAFVLELLVTHNKYTRFAINRLVQCWVPEGERAAGYEIE